MAGEARLYGRNGELWRRYCRGATQEQLGEDFGLSQAAVSRAIKDVADGIPQQERKELIDQEVDYMRGVREGLLELWDSEAPPVTQRVGDGWEYLREPETGELYRDHAGQLHSAALALKYSERMHKLLGLDAPTKMDVGVSEEAAAQAAGAEALTHLHGGTGEDT